MCLHSLNPSEYDAVMGFVGQWHVDVAGQAK
jgi:hypothetical protein